MEFREDQTRWSQVAEVLEMRITTGTYRPGQRMPSITDIHQEFGIAKTTIYKALNRLRSAGLIYTVPDIGTFVMTDEVRASERPEASGRET